MLSSQVAEFNEKVLGIAPRPLGMLEPAELELSIECLKEEVDEFVQAQEIGDMLGCIDAIIDLQYFAYGVLYKMGLPADLIEECSTLVHRANMEKKLGVVTKRGDGAAADAVKPEGWVSPEVRIANALDQYQW